jgi:DNA-binding HxlR family transcriptional regulator
MALPRQYTGQACSVAKALEVVGERWTLLIVRDAIFGVRRFSDFASHLEIPRAVLSERLSSLVDHGVMEKVAAGGRDEYVLTSKGEALWPALRALGAWGDDHYAPNGSRRIYRHLGCQGTIDGSGECDRCGSAPSLGEIETLPGPGLEARDGDLVNRALRRPHRLLEPIGGPEA